MSAYSLPFFSIISAYSLSFSSVLSACCVSLSSTLAAMTPQSSASNIMSTSRASISSSLNLETRRYASAKPASCAVNSGVTVTVVWSFIVEKFKHVSTGPLFFSSILSACCLSISSILSACCLSISSILSACCLSLSSTLAAMTLQKSAWAKNSTSMASIASLLNWEIRRNPSANPASCAVNSGVTVTVVWFFIVSRFNQALRGLPVKSDVGSFANRSVNCGSTTKVHESKFDATLLDDLSAMSQWTK